MLTVSLSTVGTTRNIPGPLDRSIVKPERIKRAVDSSVQSRWVVEVTRDIYAKHHSSYSDRAGRPLSQVSMLPP
jgi:hypothetical protein